MEASGKVPEILSILTHTPNGPFRPNVCLVVGICCPWVCADHPRVQHDGVSMITHIALVGAAKVDTKPITSRWALH